MGADAIEGVAAPMPPSDVGRVTEVRYQYSPRFPEILEEAGCSLLVSTYQAGQLVAVGVANGELAFSFHGFDQAMGIAVGADRIAVGWQGPDLVAPGPLRARPQDRAGRPLRPVLAAALLDRHRRDPVPRDRLGNRRRDEPDLWIVNTLFSCLAGLDPRYSFVPRWRPPFVSQLAPQDRCHLNGLAMRDGTPGVRHRDGAAPTSRAGGARPQRQRPRARRALAARP